MNKNSIPKHLRYTVEKFQKEFPDDDSCLSYIAEQRWPDGRTKCVSKICNSRVRKHHRVSGRTAYACDHCGNHIYPLAGTIFEHSSTSLRLWFHALYQMGSTRCGISAKQIQRDTGVTYKTAWRMFHQIRKLMAEDMKIGGKSGSGVEMDEMYYGGVRKNDAGRPLRGDRGKSPVLGIVERKGRVVAIAAENVKSNTLLTHVQERVLPKSMIYTDEFKSYDGLSHMKYGYGHRRINHSSKVFVAGDIHTNTIEGFWSLVKRGIQGVYHSVSQKHLRLRSASQQ